LTALTSPRPQERFTLKENQVLPFLEGRYTVEDKLREMKAKNKPQADMDNVQRLFTEIYSQIDSKQLRPCMRTRYNRTAYQIPFDATVRISLDTNLTMLTENPKVGPSCATSGRWYRDPNQPLPPNEVTRFPHAILEVKLSLKESELAPQWVSDLIESGMLTEVHKFSKFIHGCATLLSESVRAVPYWIDDPSIRPSILRSQPARSVKRRTGGSSSKIQTIEENEELSDDGGPGRLDVGDGPEINLMPRRPSLGGVSPSYGTVAPSHMAPAFHARFESKSMCARLGECIGLAPRDAVGGLVWLGAAAAEDSPSVHGQDRVNYKPRKVPMKVEPKTFFANERTMLSWLHMSVTMGTIGSALLTLDTPTSTLTGMLMLPVAVIFAIYAVFTFRWRGRGIAYKDSEVGFHDMFGPTVLATVLALSLTVVFFVHLFGG
jgi:uncharacterized membrane protein YidH (DUF202 family)